MSGQLRPMKAHQVLRKLERAGFVEVHRKGSHRVLKNHDTGRIVVVPVHRGHDILAARCITSSFARQG